MNKHTIDVALRIDSSPDSVYAILSDHAHLDVFRELSDSLLLRPGALDPNGLGAERQVVINMFGWLPIRFTEDITLAEPPNEFHYLISKARVMAGPVPLWAGVKHYGGQVKLAPVAGGCRAQWTSTIEVRIPLLGDRLGGIIKKEGERIFLSVLEQLKTRVERG
ncbi:MAG: SRPBCC family protein [Pseudomonadales bacterium]|nr:SRPBCC family protein [Pseudomonadales bacterium]MCP5191498.1 SRPBCC family protein [Pseudomonadales bacterium]